MAGGERQVQPKMPLWRLVMGENLGVENSSTAQSWDHDKGRI